MDRIMFVDGYDDALAFGAAGKKRGKKRSSKRSSKKRGAMTPAKLCAGAKRKKACMKAVRARKCK